MSRAAAAATGQLTTPSRHIFMTEITQPDGTKMWVISSQPLSDQSVRVHSRDYIVPVHLLMLLMQQPELKPYPFIQSINRFAQYIRTLPFHVLNAIFSYLWPMQTPCDLVAIGAYATSIRQSSLFAQLKMDPFFVVDAAMRGQEDMVMNILNADPSFLLKKAKVKNSVSVEYDVTPLQAAIMANDIQMALKMQEHFARLATDLKGNPINGLAEMRNQIKAIYIQSLNRYVDIQKAVLKEQETKLLQLLQLPTDLNEAQIKQYEEITKKIKQATNRIVDYKTALEQDDIHKIIEIHNQAQEHNAFDFQPYVDAICTIDINDPLQKRLLDDVMALINAETPAETAAAIASTGVLPTQTDVARAKPFVQLTLVEKLNRFREEFVKHMQSEIIFNPHHILAGLKINETTWNTLPHAQDPHYKKQSIIFSQLVGWAQRIAAEPVKQDIRQGTYYLTEQAEPRSRSSRFNDLDFEYTIVRNSASDVSLARASYIVDGIGYKFGLIGSRGWRCLWRTLLCLCCGGAAVFTTYIEQKHRAWKTLCNLRNHASLTGVQ